ncbi:MAG: FlgD immunoglobulin-like domain containing protein [bacterium]
MHRASRIVLSAALLALVFVFHSATATHAAEHLMQIEQVIGGVEGDTTAQAIQLRMRFANQNVLAPARVVARDSLGNNPIVVCDLTATLPGSAAGSRVLLTTAAFNALTDVPAVADFAITTPIPASYLSAGSITFQRDDGLVLWWRLSWGGANYVGPCAGLLVGNFPDGNNCPPEPGPLPSAGVQTLLFPGLFSAQGTDNATDYIVTDSSSTWFNNAGAMFVLEATSTGVDPTFEDFDASPLLIQAPFSPNPFTTSTRMAFRLNREGVARLLITDVSGREIANMEDRLGAGSHEFSWNGRDVGGTPVSAGRYFYRLDAAGSSRSGNLVLVR